MEGRIDLEMLLMAVSPLTHASWGLERPRARRGGGGGGGGGCRLDKRSAFLGRAKEREASSSPESQEKNYI